MVDSNRSRASKARIEVMLPPDMDKAFGKAAKQMGETKSALARQLIRKFLEERKG